jgi:hypothetical protein
MNLSQGRYLYKRARNKRKHPCFEWDSNPRSHCLSEDISFLRLHGHCDLRSFKIVLVGAVSPLLCRRFGTNGQVSTRCSDVWTVQWIQIWITSMSGSLTRGEVHVMFSYVLIMDMLNSGLKWEGLLRGLSSERPSPSNGFTNCVKQTSGAGL